MTLLLTVCGTFTGVMLPLNLIAILAGGSRRGQSCSASVPVGIVELRTISGDRNRGVFPYFIGLFAVAAIRECSNLTKISCCRMLLATAREGTCLLRLSTAA